MINIDVASDEELIVFLEKFLFHLYAFSKTKNKESRSEINYTINTVKKIVKRAGCYNSASVQAPPVAGGYIFDDLDPYENIFTNLYFTNIIQCVEDQVERSIGAIKAGEYRSIEKKQLLVEGHVGSTSVRDIFIVHGHDAHTKEAVARLVERLGLNSIVLHEQPSGGKTIIEKIETYSNVVFAIVVLSGDDVVQGNGEGAMHLRARQNVVLELGLFLGKLGRSNVVAIVNGDVELPGDFDGVIYVKVDEGGAWKYKVAQEMRNAGLEVDMNLVTS